MNNSTVYVSSTGFGEYLVGCNVYLPIYVEHRQTDLSESLNSIEDKIALPVEFTFCWFTFNIWLFPIFSLFLRGLTKFDTKLLIDCSNFKFSVAENHINTNVDGCTELETLTVDVQDPWEENRYFRVNMISGSTELKVTAIDEKFGIECATVLDLIWIIFSIFICLF